MAMWTNISVTTWKKEYVAVLQRVYIACEDLTTLISQRHVPLVRRCSDVPWQRQRGNGRSEGQEEESSGGSSRGYRTRERRRMEETKEDEEQLDPAVVEKWRREERLTRFAANRFVARGSDVGWKEADHGEVGRSEVSKFCDDERNRKTCTHRELQEDWLRGTVRAEAAERRTGWNRAGRGTKRTSRTAIVAVVVVMVEKPSLWPARRARRHVAVMEHNAKVIAVLASTEEQTVNELVRHLEQVQRTIDHFVEVLMLQVVFPPSWR